MASNSKLIKDWIQYLKSNQIVDQKSDPSTNKLTYRREVTADDVSNFLELKTDYTEEQISNAIHMVLAKKTIGKQQANRVGNNPTPKEPGKDLSTWMHQEMTPAQRRDAQQSGTSSRAVTPSGSQNKAEPAKIGHTPTQAPNRISHDPNSVSDVEYRDIPNSEEPPKKPGLRDRLKSKFGRKLREDIEDTPGYTLDEKDVETVFGILAKAAPSAGSGVALAGDNPEEVPSQGQAADKAREINRFKRLIRDHMSDNQRKALWRALSDEGITRKQRPVNEAEISPADVNAILKSAVSTRDNPKGFKKYFKSLQKPKIDLEDIQQAWLDAGQPDDTRDIEALLLDHGFKKPEIMKIFQEVFGEDPDDQENFAEPELTPTLAKLAEYAKRAGISKELIEFLESEYGIHESTGYSGTIMIEDIGRIFRSIVREERFGRVELLRRYENDQLGRIKK